MPFRKTVRCGKQPDLPTLLYLTIKDLEFKRQKQLLVNPIKNKAPRKNQGACLVKQIYKPNSVRLIFYKKIHKKQKALIIYLSALLPIHFSCLPSSIKRAAFTKWALVYIALHHIEFTWFHYSITCTYFLLHLS